MKKLATLLACATLLVSPVVAEAKGKVIGVSWSGAMRGGQQAAEALRKAIEAQGDSVVFRDAGTNAGQQAADMEKLAADGANALVVLPADVSAIRPALQKLAGKGIPVVGIGRPVGAGVFHLMFDQVDAGRLQAEGLFALKPEGNYAFIKGPRADATAGSLSRGQMEVLQPAIAAGKIVNVGDASTEGWEPDTARKNMEQILIANDNKVDAVIASDDATAGGVIAALEAQGLAESVPVSGRGADGGALNRIALGTQAMTVWEDPAELGAKAGEIASLLAGGMAMEAVEGVSGIKTAGGEAKAVLLAPIAITRANIDLPLKAGWADKGAVCAGVPAGTVPACD